MVDMLRNSVVTSNGFSCQHHLHSSGSHQFKSHYPYGTCRQCLSSDIKSNRRGAISYGMHMSISMEGHPLFGASKLANGPCLAPRKVASVEFESVCEEGNKLVRKEKGDNTDVNHRDKKTPPWGNLSVQMDSHSETSGAKQSSKISEMRVGVEENSIYFLEERNEEILSGRILRLSRANKIRSAMGLFSSMKYSSLRPTMHACNSLLSCLLRNGKLDDALRIFDYMKTSETITGHSYSLVLKAIANTRGCDAAFDMFEELERTGDVRKDFDPVVYNTMISVCGRVNDWVQALRLWRSMKENGLTGTQVTYRLLVCIFVRCDQNELAIDAYQEMVRSRLNPCDDAMQAVIGACSKEGNWNLALNVFENMLNAELKPSLITCNALINSIGKGGKVKLAFRVYNIMRSLGHAPDDYTWNALIGSLYRANRYGDALQLFESIKHEKSSSLNSHLYNTCLMCCQRLGLWDKALQLLWQMEASGIAVSTASYNLVIGACEAARQPKIALQVYDHMVHQNCAPDTFTLLSVIRVCIWGSLWHEVEEILQHVVTPDASLHNAAIQGMCLRGKIGLAMKLYKKMRKSNLKPDGKTRALVLQSLPKVSNGVQSR